MPAATYLPGLRALASPTKDSPPITVRHLLTMTSGLGYDDQWGAVTFGKIDAELAAFLAQGLSLGGAAGERYRYSNLGFALLGKIVASVSGKSFEQYRAPVFLSPGSSRSGVGQRSCRCGNAVVGPAGLSRDRFAQWVKCAALCG